MKKMVRIIMALSATVLTFLATTGAANACAAWFYQPEVPSLLREE